MRIIKIFLIIILFSSALAPVAFAQQSTDTVRIRFGNPKTQGVPAPPPPSDIRQGIIEKFGITMNGFDQNHLLWSWERLHEAGDGFTRHLRGTKIQATNGISSQLGCFNGETSLWLGQYQPREFFKFIFLHELAHVFQACNPRSVTKQIEQVNAYAREGGISFYAQNATRCISGVTNQNEDYADMIAYYLDRSAGFASGPKSCGGPSNPPNPYDAGYPLHLEVVKSIF